jgi:DNA/RNA-binding domain of Phe-tRNA-synthetase-like protein
MESIMHFVVAPECIQLGLRAGAIAFRDLRVTSSLPELREEVAWEAQSVQKRFASAAAIRSDVQIAAFHEIHRKVGGNPRRDQPSVERLLTFALKRSTLPAVNSLVDAYNLVSVRFCCSLGAHDLDRIALPVSLQIMSAVEKFLPLGGDAEIPVTPGEYGYVDGRGRVLCRLDVVQSDFSKVTEATRNALLIVEGTAAHPPEILSQALQDAKEQVVRCCGGIAEVLALP